MSSSADEAVVALDGESDQLLGGGEAPELVEPFQEKDEGAFPWLKLLLALVVIGGRTSMPSPHTHLHPQSHNRTTPPCKFPFFFHLRQLTRSQ